jgi:hypothetical protein
VTSSQFAKYFCDTYSKYITPCTVMTYATSDAIRVTLCGYAPYAHGLRSDPAEWIILQMARKRKLANWLLYSEHRKKFHIIYYSLYMLIMQVYHDFGHMHKFDRMPDSSRMSRLRSTSELRTSLLTPVAHHDSGQWACHLSYHLSCERLRIARQDDCSIL